MSRLRCFLTGILLRTGSRAWSKGWRCLLLDGGCHCVGSGVGLVLRFPCVRFPSRDCLMWVRRRCFFRRTGCRGPDLGGRDCLVICGLCPFRRGGSYSFCCSLLRYSCLLRPFFVWFSCGWFCSSVLHGWESGVGAVLLPLCFLVLFSGWGSLFYCGCVRHALAGPGLFYYLSRYHVVFCGVVYGFCYALLGVFSREGTPT